MSDKRAATQAPSRRFDFLSKGVRVELEALGLDASGLMSTATGVDSEATMLCLKGIVELSNGSACTSASYTPSHVLAAMGYDNERIQSSIRISWSHMTDDIPWDSMAERITAVQGP